METIQTNTYYYQQAVTKANYHSLWITFSVFMNYIMSFNPQSVLNLNVIILFWMYKIKHINFRKIRRDSF